jgi:hypothetical protein
LKRASKIGPHFSPADSERSTVKPTSLSVKDAQRKLVGTLNLDHAVIDGLHMLLPRSAWIFDFPTLLLSLANPAIYDAVVGGVSIAKLT